MTSTEINEAVARKLGWTQKPHSVRAGVVQEAIFWHKPIDDGRGYGVIPDFCHSIAAVWEVVEKSDSIILSHELDAASLEKRWSCVLNNSVGAIADTAPMAICLAFLKS